MDLRAILKRAAADLALLLAIGLFMGAVGPYGTDELPPRLGYVYWLICIVGGGLIGIAIDETAGRRAGMFWRRLAVTTLLMTPPTTLLVMAAGWLVAGGTIGLSRAWPLLWQVLLISIPVMAIRALVWRRPPPVVETRVVVAPPLPEAEAVFRRRLSARRRGARLIAIEADDHYLKVHTDAGSEMVTLRLAGALDELSGRARLPDPSLVVGGGRGDRGRALAARRRRAAPGRRLGGAGQPDPYVDRQGGRMVLSAG
jgi:hypothetical protein